VSWTESGPIHQTRYNRDSDPGITVSGTGRFYAVILSFDQFSEAIGLLVPVAFDSGNTWTLSLTGVDTPFGTFEDREMSMSPPPVEVEPDTRIAQGFRLSSPIFRFLGFFRTRKGIVLPWIGGHRPVITGECTSRQSLFRRGVEEDFSRIGTGQHFTT